jgi:hypothetical protein
MDVLQKLSRSWSAYLEGFYDRDLVAKMFLKIPLTLPDSTHYFVDPVADVREAILPFPVQDLRLDPTGSEFEVIVVGHSTTGVATQVHQTQVHYSGVVDPTMAGISQRLIGCIRIYLKDSPILKLLNGKVFITQYQRKLYDDDADTEDFLNGI